MGVNFPDVRFIINWGPARSILDQHQEAGRAARDRKRAHVVVIYHRQQVGHCEQQIKEFVHTEGCFRVAAYKSLDDIIQPLFMIPVRRATGIDWVCTALVMLISVHSVLI